MSAARFTLADLPEHLRSQAAAQLTDAGPAPALAAPDRVLVEPPARSRKVSQPTPGVMNKTEARHADTLALQKARGEILWFAFETYRLRLAYRTTYVPDFAVMLPTNELEFHEVKGEFVRDDGLVKVKLAARLLPHRFVLWQWLPKDGGWHRKVLPNA